MNDWDGPWPGVAPFVFPEALRLVSKREAETFVHGGCPYCETAMRKARRYKDPQVLVNAKTRDVLGVFI